MDLLCDNNLLDQNSETLYQFEEGQRAHTIKFMPNPIKLQNNLNSKNNSRDFQKNTINPNINKEIFLKNKVQIESNKCSNNTSELEIIEYPINEFKKNDFKNINDIILSKAKDYINDKSQNDILDYLKEKQGLNYLSLLLENDKSSNDSKSNNNENNNNDSSKSDEIICSYVEIDHNNSIISRMQKEKSVIKPKIFSQIHQASYSDYSLGVKNLDNTNKNKIPKTINVSKSKSKNKDKDEEKKIKVTKNIKKIRTDMKFKKIFKHNNQNNNNNEHLNLKKNKKIEKEERIKSFMLVRENENLKISEIIKSNKKKIIFDKKNKLDTFRSIDYLTNINSISHNYKNTLNALNSKGKKSSGKSQIINSERAKTNFQINKNVNTISKDKNYTHLYKNIRGNSINYKSKKNTNNKSSNNNPLFNSINLKRNNNNNNNINNNKKGNFLSLKKSLLTSMRIDSKNKVKAENTTTGNSKSKLRKLLINNINNNKHNCDLSMYNIKSISNNTKLLIKKEKNKNLNKLMNKSEANKKINQSTQLKTNNSDNNKQFKNNLMQTSISKILKV